MSPLLSFDRYAGDIEGTWFLAGHDLISLSEQQLTSCDRLKDGGQVGDTGCAGSITVLDTFKYVQENGGIATEGSYPLCSSNKSCVPSTDCTTKGKTSCKKEKKNGVCDKTKESRAAAKISGYYQVSGGVRQWAPDIPLPVNETAMMEALVKTGPVQSKIRVPLFATCTLNVKGQPRVTLSMRQKNLRAACGLWQEERSA